MKKWAHAWPIVIIGRNTRPMVAFSGILESPKPPPLGDVHGNVPAHCYGYQFGHLFRDICWLLFVCLLPWRPLGQYGVSSCPMPASSGFRSSPGHAASGNAICIAPAHLQDLWNRPQRRCIYLSLLIFVIDHNRIQITCYSQYKLKLRHSNIYYNIISLLLCFRHPPTTMDAVSATIDVGGQANIN